MDDKEKIKVLSKEIREYLDEAYSLELKLINITEKINRRKLEMEELLHNEEAIKTRNNLRNKKGV